MDTPVIAGFKGEDRLLSSDVLPDNIAQDGLNNDYSALTIRKRLGRTKLHTEAMLEGGVRINNSSTAKCIIIPAQDIYDFSGDFTIEFAFKLMTLNNATDRPLITCRNTSTTKGWYCSINTSNEASFTYYDGGGTARTVTAASYISGQSGIPPAQRYHFCARRSGNDITVRIANLDYDATTTSSAATASGYSTLDRDIYVGASDGATPGNATNDFIIDELRFWTVYRTDAQVAAAANRELTEDEIHNNNLVGYWRFNDGWWNACQDFSHTRNAAFFDAAGPSFRRSIVPNDPSVGFAVSFDGADDKGVAAYHADYAPILDTGNEWTIEAWVQLERYESDASYEGFILQLGSYDTGNGSPFSWVINNSAANRRFILRISTTTTYNNLSLAPNFEFSVGVPVHIACVRNGATAYMYVNGEPITFAVSLTTENGPTSDTNYGMTFGAKNSSGTYSAYSPFTIDEVRLWKIARSREQIKDNYARRLSNITDDNLVGYWRFDTADKEYDHTGRSDITFTSDGSKPEWSQGIVYPIDPPRMLLAAPLVAAPTANEVRSRDDQVGREMVVATRTGFWSLVGFSPVLLRDMYTPGEPTLFDWCHYKEKLVFCNGIEENTKYDGAELPRAVSLEQPSASPAVATGAAGNLSGTYNYRVSFRNSNDGTESLASAASSDVTPSSQSVDLSSIPTSSDPQVNQRRIYRKDPDSSLYRYLADVDDNTTTTYNDDTADISSNAAVDDLRGHVNPGRYCCTFNNRLWFGNMSDGRSQLRYSEADDESAFTPANYIEVDQGDGDQVTGLISAFGGLVIFKQRSIHFLVGDGPTTYQMSRTITGIGCVSGHTIAESPEGIYFLGYDGVYLLRGPQQVEATSVNQRSIFEKLDPRYYQYAQGIYDGIQHTYLITFDVSEVKNQSYYEIQPNIYYNYWPLESDATDSVGNHDLTATSSPVYVSDSAMGSCVEFDGTDDFLRNQAQTTYHNPVTFGCWIQPASLSPGFSKAVIRLEDSSNAASHYLTLGTLGEFWGNGASDLIPKTQSYTARKGGWYHVVVASDGDVCKLYVNGKLAAIESGGTDTAGLTGTGELYIGGDGSTFCDCRIKNAFTCTAVLDPSQIRDIYEYESNIGFANTDRLTMAFDEESRSWAKWNASPDYWVLTTHWGERHRLFSVNRGFVFQEFSSYTDGSDYREGFPITRSGSVSALNSNEVSDSDWDFPTDGDGLAGTPIVFKNTADSKEQKTIVLSNTSTKLYLGRKIHPAITGTFRLAPIDWFWESRWMDLGNPMVKKRLQRFMALVTEDSTATVTLKWKSTENETWQSTTFTTADESIHKITNHRGRRFKIRLEAYDATMEEIEIKSFQLRFEPRDIV